MKKIKKTLSIILVTVLLISAVPMNSFALFDWIWPEVVKVELVNNMPLSNKHIKNLDSWYGMADTYLYDIGTEKQIYKLYFSNGRTVEVDNYELYGTDLLSGVLYAGVTMRVSKEECAKAIAEGKNKVNVKVTAVVYYLNDNFRLYSFEMEREIVDEIVTSVELIDPMPENFNYNKPEESFVGKNFEVEYADGRKETLTLEDGGDSGYFLGDEYISMWYGEDSIIDKTTGETKHYVGLEFWYLDTLVILERKYIDCPYSTIEISDYKVNGKGGVTELTYKLTYKDGRIIEKHCVFDKPIDYKEDVVIDTVDGNDITIGTNGSIDSYYIYAEIGYAIWNVNEAVEAYDIENFCDCRCHKRDLLNIIVNSFICKVWEIFRINEYCQCGKFHW